MINNNIKPTTYFFGAAVGLIIGYAIFSFVGFITGANSLETRLNKTIKEYNTHLPQQIDEYMRIDSIKSSSEKVINHYITVNIDKEEADYESIKENIHPNMLNNIKTASSLDIFRKNKFTWKYLFYDKNGRAFHEFTITPEMYL